MKTPGELSIQVDNHDDQLKRLVAHFDSERDVRTEQGKRIDSTSSALHRLEKQLEKHEAIIFNRGKGLSFEVDRLVREGVETKDAARWNTSTIISIISALTSAAAVIITMIRT